MSFFDPAGVFGGGGGGGFRDPLGIFGGGRRQMSPQEIAQAQGGGGQSQRANAFGGGFGGASGYRGQGMRESDFGGPPEMAAPAPQAGGPSWGGGALGGMGAAAPPASSQYGQAPSRRGGMPAPQGGGFGGDMWAGGSPGMGNAGWNSGSPVFTYESLGGGKPSPVQSGGPAPGAMMQSQGGQQWGQLASALAQQGGPQGMSGGIRRFASMNLQPSADPYGAPRRATAGLSGGKYSGPRG